MSKRQKPDGASVDPPKNNGDMSDEETRAYIEGMLEGTPRVPKKPLLRNVFKRVFLILGLTLGLAFAYVFLLLGEPDEDAKLAETVAEERITMPMNAMEAPGDSDTQALANVFGQPVLVLYGSSLQMQRSRISDVAFDGAYARRVSVSYAFADGTLVSVESVRPKAAVALLGIEGGVIDIKTLYALGGIDAGRMDNGSTICVFGQNDAAAYAVLCPKSHEGDLVDILGHTALVLPAVNE